MKKGFFIQLLGTFRIVYKGEYVNGFKSPRLQELLAWLLLNRDSPQPRRQIAFQFWPNSSDKQALTNLRQLLHHLRKSLPDADQFLESDNKVVQWKKNGNLELDVDKFRQHLEKAEAALQSNKITDYDSELTKAVSLYKGPLLQNCYRKWIEPERDQLHQNYLRVLEKLIEIKKEERDYTAAIQYNLKLRRFDPFRETTYRSLMNLYALNNERANIEKTWESCVSFFKKELNINPSAETCSLYERLISSSESKTEPVKNVSVKALNTDWPLVGRVAEWNQMLSCWQHVLSGNREFLLISGEPGIGKSRLGLELFEHIRKQGYSVAYARSYESAGTLSYGPVTDWLRSSIVREKIEKLDPVWLKEISRLLPELQAEYPDIPKPGPMNEKWQRQQFFEAIKQAFQDFKTPVMLFLDDLQWCDRETLNWLNYLFHTTFSGNILVAGTLRPAEGASNKSLIHLMASLRRIDSLTEIELEPLDKTDTYELAAKISDDTTEISSDYLFRETEGNPLFVIEMVRKGLFKRKRKGFEGWKASQNVLVGTGPQTELPPKVNEVISARFDQLSEHSRETAWLASAIGREFSFELLKLASGQNETEIIRSLEELLHHHIIREHQSDIYDFSHDKLREVAYQSMSNVRRKAIHNNIAFALENFTPGNIKSYSSRIAYHCDRAGLCKQAVRYYLEASKHARNMYANEEAITLLNRALELLNNLPEEKTRDHFERDIQSELSLILCHIKSYGNEKVMRACKRVFSICKKLDQLPPFPVERIFAIGSLCEAKPKNSCRLGMKLYQKAIKHGDPVEVTEACYVLGSALVRQADYSEAKKYYEEGLEWYDQENQTRHIQRFGQDPSVICLVRLSMIEWLTGYPKSSESYRKQALQKAEKIDHPFSLDYIRSHIAWLFQLQHKIDETHNMAEITLETSNEHGYPYWIAYCEVLLGWALFKKGSIKRGIKKMRKGIQQFEDAHIKIDRPYFSSLLAEALAEDGALEEAEKIVLKAIKQINETNDRWMEPEVHRIKGKIDQLNIARDSAVSRKRFQLAAKVAHTQNATTLEQRALDSLKKNVPAE